MNALSEKLLCSTRRFDPSLSHAIPILSENGRLLKQWHKDELTWCTSDLVSVASSFPRTHDRINTSFLNDRAGHAPERIWRASQSEKSHKGSRNHLDSHCLQSDFRLEWCQARVTTVRTVDTDGIKESFLRCWIKSKGVRVSVAKMTEPKEWKSSKQEWSRSTKGGMKW